MDELTEDICRRLRETVKEFGQDKLWGAVVIGSEYEGNTVGGVEYLHAPTVQLTLGRVDFKVARYFEDI